MRVRLRTPTGRLQLTGRDFGRIHSVVDIGHGWLVVTSTGGSLTLARPEAREMVARLQAALDVSPREGWKP